MARIPTTYTSGLATSPTLQAPSAVRVPSDLGQEIPRALMNFGQTLEKSMWADVRTGQEEEYRNNVSKFKEDLASTHADLLKKKEEIDTGTASPESKQARFATYAQEQQDKLFATAPKHIVQDYKANFISMVTPIEMQVANNAQAAQAMQLRTNMIVRFDQAQADIDAIAASAGTPAQRQAEFNEYIKQQAATMLTGSDKLPAVDRERLIGQIEALKGKANDRFLKQMDESTQMEARVSLDGLLQTTLNSPSAAQDPASTAQALKDAIATYGNKTGLTAMQIQDLTQKVASDAWNNSVISKATQNANEKHSLGQQVALDRKLVSELTAQKDNQYLYGGSEYDIKDRNARVAFLQNRIESNMNAMRAEALRRSSEKAVSYFQSINDPLKAAADNAGIKLVPISMSDPSGSLMARNAQRVALRQNVLLTAEESAAIGNKFLSMKTPTEAFSWLSGLVKGAPPDVAQATLGLVMDQVHAAAPAASRAINLFAGGRPQEALTYYELKQTQRIDGSNTELKRNYDDVVNQVRRKFSGVLRSRDLEAFADIAATLSLQIGAKPDSVIEAMVGTKRSTGAKMVPNWVSPSHEYLVPPGQNGDRIANFFKNPSKEFLTLYKIDAEAIRGNKPVYSGDGYDFYKPNGEPVVDGYGKPVRVPFSMFGGK